MSIMNSRMPQMPRNTGKSLSGFLPYKGDAVFRSDPRNARGLGTDAGAPVLEWGGPSNFGPDNESGFEIKNNSLTETSRNVAVKRVFNPEDSSQYVDVETIKDITFVDQEQQKFSYKFKDV